MNPLFSIITPCFGAVDHLSPSLDSVLSQAPDLFEYIIVDGASTDGTLSLLKRQTSPQIRWISEPDTGVYDAMNKGIRLARGRFLLFLGAGDLLSAGILSKAATRISQLSDGKLHFLYGDVHYRVLARVGDGLFSKRRLCRSNICHQSIFYEKDLFNHLGFYELEYRVYADWVFNLKCFGSPKVETIYWPEVIADYQGNGLSDKMQDLVFGHNLPRLIRTHLGASHAVRHWLRSQIRHRSSQIQRRLLNKPRASRSP